MNEQLHLLLSVLEMSFLWGGWVKNVCIKRATEILQIQIFV